MNNFDKIEEELCSKIADDKGHRLIRYALDTDFLSDETYTSYPGFISQARPEDVFNELKKYPHLTRLFWVRAFFENGQGNDPWQSMRGSFPNCDALNVRTNYQQMIDMAGHLFDLRRIQGADPVDNFRTECWLVGGNQNPEEVNGRTSEIWRFLSPLVRKLRADADEEAMHEVASRFVDKMEPPAYFKWLIETRDVSFYEVLRALRKQRGEGWLTRIAPLMNKLQDHASLDAAWMLYLNGNIRRLDLVITNIYIPNSHGDILSIRQGNIKKECTIAKRRQLHFTLKDLKELGLNDSLPFAIAINGRKVLQVKPIRETFPADHTIAFRYPLKVRESWLPMVSNDQIDARRIVVMTSPRHAVGTLEGQSITALVLGDVSLSISDRRDLYEVCFDNFTDAPQRRLSWNNLQLIIGQKPYLEINQEMPHLRLLDDETLDDETVSVVTGKQTTVFIKNVVAGQAIPIWTIDGDPAQVKDGSITVSGDYGDKKIVRYGDVKATILFVPSFDDQLNGWVWQPENNTEKAEEGFEVGTFKVQNGHSFRMSHPLTKIVWWWQNIPFGVPEYINRIKDFNDHSEMMAYRLAVWVPEGLKLVIKFGTEHSRVSLQTLTSGAFNKIGLGKLLQNHRIIDGIGSEIDQLTFNEEHVANIFRVPKNPTIVIQGDQPWVFFPELYDPSRYSILGFYESGIKDNKIEVVQCKRFDRQVLQRVELNHQRINIEGYWLALVDKVPKNESLLEVARLSISPTNVIQWMSPGDISLADRLGVEAGSPEANQVSGLLDYLSFTLTPLRQNGIFAEAIENRAMLHYSNRPEFWNKYFQEHCQIEVSNESPSRGRCLRNQPQPEPVPTPLEETLSLMLRAGFNWFCEPNWLTWAYNQIPDAMRWSRMSPQREQRLEEYVRRHCSPMLAQKSFENDEIANGYFAYILRNPQGVFGLRCPEVTEIESYNTGVKIRSIDANNGISICGDPQRVIHSITHSYHGDNCIRTSFYRDRFFRFVGWLPKDKKDAFLSFMLDGNNIADNCIFGDEDSKELNEKFVDSINLAKTILGVLEDRGLGYMFMSVAEAFLEWDQSSRAVIFQAAVLCRLHAWIGWKNNDGLQEISYPDAWPLNDPKTYELVCRVASCVWNDDNLREVFVNDLIPVEWMLSMFHN